jgi:hypothetical protein
MFDGLYFAFGLAIVLLFVFVSPRWQRVVLILPT